MFPWLSCPVALRFVWSLLLRGLPWAPFDPVPARPTQTSPAALLPPELLELIFSFTQQNKLHPMARKADQAESVRHNLVCRAWCRARSRRTSYLAVGLPQTRLLASHLHHSRYASSHAEELSLVSVQELGWHSLAPYARRLLPLCAPSLTSLEITATVKEGEARMSLSQFASGLGPTFWSQYVVDSPAQLILVGASFLCWVYSRAEHQFAVHCGLGLVALILLIDVISSSLHSRLVGTPLFHFSSKARLTKLTTLKLDLDAGPWETEGALAELCSETKLVTLKMHWQTRYPHFRYRATRALVNFGALERILAPLGELRHLDLGVREWTLDHLPRMVARLSQLESFKWVYKNAQGEAWVQETGGYELDPGPIQRVLREARSLKRLQLHELNWPQHAREAIHQSGQESGVEVVWVGDMADW